MNANYNKGGQRVTPKEAIEVFNNPTQHWPHEREQAIALAIDALEKQSADGCEGCKYIHKDEYEMPCLICKRNKLDKWTEDNE